MTGTADSDLQAGVRNLLLTCARAQPGDRILLVGEAGDAPYFDPALCTAVAGIAPDLGLRAKVVMAPPVADAQAFPEIVRDAMQQADRTIFFSRLGDQVRFSLPEGKARAVMTYTLDLEYLAGPFGAADFTFMKRMHDALLDRILQASRYRITGACGTDLTGELGQDRSAAVADFAVDLFPVMIFPPIKCLNLHGTLVIRHFVTSSSTRAYDDSTLVLDEPITAHVEGSRLVAFDGPSDLVSRLQGQLDRAAALTGGDPLQINSWHTGINPNTFYNGDPYVDLERWGTVAYGSPRYTHMHLAGHDPGDAAFHMMDMTISFDDVPFWDAGRFVFLDRPDVQALMDPSQRALLNSHARHDIGI